MADFFCDQQTDTLSSAIRWEGGSGIFYVRGTFAGATVGLQASFNNGESWLLLDGTDVTEPAELPFSLGICRIRAWVVESSAETCVTAGIEEQV